MGQDLIHNIMSFFITKKITLPKINNDIIKDSYNYEPVEPSNMKYIVATSDISYFRWQMLIQINNFKRLGMLKHLTYIVSTSGRKSSKLVQIEKQTGVKIYTYTDTRKSSSYSSSIRPHILTKHFKLFPEQSKIFYYLDPDVIFLEKPFYDDIKFTTPDWFVSDTRSYLDTKYIKSKGNELFKQMCKAIDIDSELVEKMDSCVGGAQYIMKNANSEYWAKVEKDSEILYNLMISTSQIYNPEHPIQAWTADMWAVIWNAWKMGVITRITKYMDFLWATNRIINDNKSIIFHNAGVFDQKNLFNKSKYFNKHPFNDDLSFVDEKYCSIIYVNEIKDTIKNYNELIKKL